MELYTIVGQAIKPHGLKGELKIITESIHDSAIAQADALFFEIDGKFLPYFIESLRQGNATILKLEGIDTKEAALQLSRSPFALPTEAVKLEGNVVLENPHDFFKTLENYTLIDQEKGTIGTIDNVIEMPQQSLAVVQYAEKEVLIPLNDQLIVQIDPKAKSLIMDLPEGLLEL